MTVLSTRTSADNNPLSPSNYTAGKTATCPAGYWSWSIHQSPHSSQHAIQWHNAPTLYHVWLVTAITVLNSVSFCPLTGCLNCSLPVNNVIVTHSRLCYHNTKILIINVNGPPPVPQLLHILVFLTTDCRSVPLKDHHHHWHHSQHATIQHQQLSMLYQLHPLCYFHIQHKVTICYYFDTVYRVKELHAIIHQAVYWEGEYL